MTNIRDVTLNHRYAVYVDFKGGATGHLVNTYSRPEVADKAVAVLSADVPQSFIERAYVIDCPGPTNP